MSTGKLSLYKSPNLDTPDLGPTTVRAFCLHSQNCQQLSSCKGISTSQSLREKRDSTDLLHCLKYKMVTIFTPVYWFNLRQGPLWLSLQSRRIRRLLKLMIILLSCYLIYYFASISLKQTTCVGGRNGRLTVSIWRNLCGDDVNALRSSPFYPSFPSEKNFIREISEFEIEDKEAEYGQTIAGFLNPVRNGSYRFAIASDGSSELWFSPSENPEGKQLIASVSVEGATGWPTKNELNKYPNQISRDIELREGGRYYIEVIHKQGEGDGFVQVFWSTPGVTDFKLICSEYLSPCSAADFAVSPKQDAMNQLLANRLAISQAAWKKYSRFFTLPLISEVGYLPQCKYKSSFIPKDKLDNDNGLFLVYLSNVFPQDDTFMGRKGNVKSWSNRAADRNIVQSVVDKMISSLCEKTDK